MATAGGFWVATGDHARIARALAELTSAFADLKRTNACTRLNICCIPGFASRWLLSRLREFRETHPAFEVEIHPTDTPPDFTQGDADADLRFVPLAKLGDSALGAHTVEIARPNMFPVASPRLMRELASIKDVASLLTSPLLHEANQDEWKAWLEGNGVPVERMLPGPRLWHANLTLDAAARGEGIALANSFLLADEAESGRLVQLQVGKPMLLGAYVFSCRKDRWELPAMMQFRSWLRRRVTSSLTPVPARADR